jgi:succinyl-diaminopimelate desuccinylase
VPASDGLHERLAARTLDLVDVASESRAEGALAGRVLALLRDAGVEARDGGDTCVLAGVTERRDRPLLLLAGHLDTVPAQGNRPGSLDDDAVHGLGAADMKGAVAVMLELALAGVGRDAPLDLGLVLFGREELPVSESALTPLLDREPGLRTADAVVVMEPTANAIQAGCLGNLNATWTFTGRSGHSARPWLADNAIDRAIAGLAPIAGLERREAIVGGLPFYEVVTITRLNAGIADNVVPDRATAHVNVRYAPDRDPAGAEAYLRSLVPEGASVELAGNSPAATPATDSPLVDRLRQTGDLELEPKQAWTNVADFAARDIPAVNFGPGATRYAHARDEQVEIDALVRAYEVLRRFLAAR